MPTRKLSILDFMRMFPDDMAAQDFFTECRWPNGTKCPYCDEDTAPYSHKSMPWWCNQCRKSFSARTDTAMQSSRIGYQKWLFAMYLTITRKKV